MGYIGLDIGGTNVRYAFTNDLELKLLECQKRPFRKTGHVSSEVEKNICDIINMTSNSVDGIGISLAAIMDRNNGKVKNWPNNSCWNCYELVDYLRGKYNAPVLIEDDANCGAIGEYDSLSTSVKNMVYITIGTGIGCGLILNGSIFIGDHGFAGELGHVCVSREKNENICSCGNKGCFQSIASGPSVLKEYNKFAKEKLKSFEQVYNQYMEGESDAVKCLSNMINNIARVIFNLAMSLDISLFVIGGGVSNAGLEFISNIESEVNVRLKRFRRAITIKQAQLGEYSGVYGALQLLKRRIL